MRPSNDRAVHAAGDKAPFCDHADSGDDASPCGAVLSVVAMEIPEEK